MVKFVGKLHLSNLGYINFAIDIFAVALIFSGMLTWILKATLWDLNRILMVIITPVVAHMAKMLRVTNETTLSRYVMQWYIQNLSNI